MKDLLRPYLLIIFLLILFASCERSVPIPEDTPVIPEPADAGGPGSFDIHIEKFYYGFDEKIYLNTRANKLLVCYRTEQYASEGTDKLKTVFEEINFRWRDKLIIIMDTQNKYTIPELHEQLKKQSGIRFIKPVYAFADTDSELLVMNDFVVKFKPEVLLNRIDSINLSYSVKLKDEGQLFSVYTVPDSSDVVQVANAYQESGLVVFSHPNFIGQVSLPRF